MPGPTSPLQTTLLLGSSLWVLYLGSLPSQQTRQGLGRQDCAGFVPDHSNRGSHIVVRQCALSGAVTNEGACGCVDMWWAAPSLPQPRSLPWDSSGHRQAALQTDSTCISASSVHGLSGDSSVFHRDCQGKTGSQTDHLPCMSVPLLCALRDMGALLRPPGKVPVCSGESLPVGYGPWVLQTSNTVVSSWPTRCA